MYGAKDEIMTYVLKEASFPKSASFADSIRGNGLRLQADRKSSLSIVQNIIPPKPSSET